MESISKEGSSAIIIQLDPDQTTADKAKTDIKDVVDAGIFLKMQKKRS